MVRTPQITALATAAAALTLQLWTSSSAQAVNWHRPFVEESQPDVFYNHYVPNANGPAAAMYPAPHPTPPHVGHTYFTYQPFMPHEMMYRHSYTHHQYFNGGMGLNRTRVKWYPAPFGTFFKGLHYAVRVPR